MEKVKARGDPNHPVTRGAICRRGPLRPDHVHHSQRLNIPLQRLGDRVGPDTIDVQHGWWFPEPNAAPSELFGVFESKANPLCPDDPELGGPEVGSRPHSALMARLEKA
jgi:hypothetical protein